MDPVEILWQDARETTFLARCDFDKAIAQCEVYGVDGVAAILIKGPEIHCASIKDGWINRRVIKQHLGRLIDKYGYATSMIHINDTAGRTFAERLGFKLQNIEGIDCFYRIERAKHG